MPTIVSQADAADIALSDAELMDKYPHIYPAQIAVVRKHSTLIAETGGNPILDLINDFQNPGTDERPNRLMSTNIVRFVLAVAVRAQVALIMRLEASGKKL